MNYVVPAVVEQAAVSEGMAAFVVAARPRAKGSAGMRDAVRRRGVRASAHSL